MKRLTLFIVALLVLQVHVASAQVGTAMMYSEQGILDKAKIAIDKACANPKSASKAKTWFYKGEIYSKIANTDPTLPYFKLDKKAVQTALEAYKKAMELDTKKKAMYKDSESGIKRLGNIATNHAVNLYKTKELGQSVADLKTAHNINPDDSTIQNYGAIISYENKNTDDYLFFAKKYLSNKVVPFKNKVQHYVNVAITYRQEKKDYNSAISIAQQGNKEDPNNKMMYTLLGELYLFNKQEEKTINTYKKALAKFPNDFDFNKQLGNIYFNKGAVISENLDKKAAQAVITKQFEIIDGHIKTALPYLEKAHQIKPKDLATIDLITLCYQQLDDEAKVNMYKKKAKALGK